MAIFSKIFSFFMSFVMSIMSIFGLGGEKNPEFELGENVISDVAQVLEVYNNAVIKTDEDAPLVKNTLSLEDLKMVSSSSLISVATPMLKDVLEDNVYENNDIPGEGKLKAEDVVSAKMSTEEGKTTVIIEVKDQTNDAYGNAKDGESVSNAIGTLGDIADYIEGTGIISSVENIEITYTECRIACIIDDATGEILCGEWYCNMTMVMDGVVINIGESPIEITNTSVTIGMKYKF